MKIIYKSKYGAAEKYAEMLGKTRYRSKVLY